VSRTPDLQVRSLRTVVAQPISHHLSPVWTRADGQRPWCEMRSDGLGTGTVRAQSLCARYVVRASCLPCNLKHGATERPRRTCPPSKFDTVSAVHDADLFEVVRACAQKLARGSVGQSALSSHAPKLQYVRVQLSGDTGHTIGS